MNDVKKNDGADAKRKAHEKHVLLRLSRKPDCKEDDDKDDERKRKLFVVNAARLR